MTEPANFLVSDADLPALRNVIVNLTQIGYSEAKVRERLGLRDLADLQWQALPLYRDERLAGRDPLDLAVDVFLLQGILPREELGRLFTPRVTENSVVASIGSLLRRRLVRIEAPAR
jgi:hypothetical protein